MFGKKSKLFSIVRMKCPKCHQGNFFEGHPYNFKTIGQVKEKCSNCDLKYSIEPGFFQGSYYVSYALGVALFISIAVLKILFFASISYVSTIILMVSSLVVLSPLLYALSKIIYINLFVNYDENSNKEI